MKNPALSLPGNLYAPLKALPQRPLSAANGHPSPARVYSLKNLKDLVKQMVRPLRQTLPDDVECQNDPWYNHYE